MIKKLIKRVLRMLGVEIRRYSITSTSTGKLVKTLREFEINLVLDVGANSGQFASGIRCHGYTGDIVSFEPLLNAYAELLRSSQGDTKWAVHPRCAIGDHNGEAEINIAGNSVSSSLLTMMDSHLTAAPNSAYVGKESVSLLTLDSVSYQYDVQEKNTFLKIDTQGFEWAVLDGAQSVIQNVRGVLLELSLTPLYEGQHLWRELIERLEREGFVLWALEPEFIDPASGRLLQANGIFFRE